jgi:hypothetical protein
LEVQVVDERGVEHATASIEFSLPPPVAAIVVVTVYEPVPQVNRYRFRATVKTLGLYGNLQYAWQAQAPDLVHVSGAQTDTFSFEWPYPRNVGIMVTVLVTDELGQRAEDQVGPIGGPPLHPGDLGIGISMLNARAAVVAALLNSLGNPAAIALLNSGGHPIDPRLGPALFGRPVP